ncbi:hypothetical protein [Streptomyces glomeratus]|uniref:hypothetical protein n=2 Tax=Streptomyces glomeratus TaxID=284452 RepID=UPI001F24C2D6|nr:hypothetical protein [Streptomyces glomeratus]MCF1510457.1 hypothetical protein [Streptomyces glomeratus]
MNSWIRRVPIALASVAMAGGALLGAGGSASAATAAGPVDHTQSSIAAFGTGDGRDDYRNDGHASGQGKRDDDRDAHRGWHTDDDRRGHHHGRHHHRRWEKRWVGHHLYVWNGHRWVEVTSWHDAGVGCWYLDQLVLVSAGRGCRP